MRHSGGPHAGSQVHLSSFASDASCRGPALDAEIRIKAEHTLDQIIAVLQTPAGFSKLAGNQRKFLFSVALASVVPADLKVRPREIEKLRMLLSTQLRVPAPMLDEAMALADDKVADPAKLDHVAKALHELLGVEDRATLVGHLWSLALADGELHESEERLIYRLADLAGVPRKHVAERLARASAQG